MFFTTIDFFHIAMNFQSDVNLERRYFALQGRHLRGLEGPSPPSPQEKEKKKKRKKKEKKKERRELWITSNYYI